MTYSTSKQYRVKESVSHPKDIEGDSYMRQWSRSPLVRVMACLLCSGKPIPVPIMTLSIEPHGTYFRKIWIKTCWSSFNNMEIFVAEMQEHHIFISVHISFRCWSSYISMIVCGLYIHGHRSVVIMKPRCVNRIALNRWDSYQCVDNWDIFGDCLAHID